ncbi:MAG: hypothetical protein ACE5F6_08260 [Anaerolineae bacterium]
MHPKIAGLDRADESLARARVYLRLAARWGWLSGGQRQPRRAMN